VRAFAVRVLEQAGFTVLEARDGNEAVARVERHRGPLDIIVTDVVMPGPTGPVTVERIRAMRPGVPALFVTGYASRSITSERGLGTALLQKPFRHVALLERIEALLAQGHVEAPGPAMAPAPAPDPARRPLS
jgi:CheY-like chemotaxis protein